MRVKTLILGALPLPSEGPWINLVGARVWRYVPKVNYKNGVEIHVQEYASAVEPRRIGLHDREEVIQGHMARVVIMDPPPQDVKEITIELQSDK